MSQHQVGRVFFCVDPQCPHGIPTEMRIVTLECHVNNVAKLAKAWESTKDNKSFEGDKESPLWKSTKPMVLRAAERHDQAKPSCFKLTYKAGQGFGYSFAGHRFRVPPQEPYVDALIRGHHDFSVSDIVEAAYRLRSSLVEFYDAKEDKSQELEDLLELTQQTDKFLARYRDDLYILEMCDQIEASLESWLLDYEKAQPRNFMDFTVSEVSTTAPPAPEPKEQLSLFAPQRALLQFEIEPFPWTPVSELKMDFQYMEFEVPQELRGQLHGLLEEEKHDPAAKALKSWLMKQVSAGELLSKSAIIQPYSAEKPHPSKAQLQEIFTFPKGPNPMQRRVACAFDGQHGEGQDADLFDGVALLLKAPTGSGKTEALLWPALEHGRRLLLALPARALLDDHAQRIHHILDRAAKITGRTYTRIIDTGARVEQMLYTPQGPKKGHRRHLYKADIILTTLDKLIFRYFGYSDKHKSMVFPYRIEQSKTLLCFDEAHSYDGLAWSNFRMLVEALYQTGQDLVLMSATMPPTLYEAFPYLERLDFSQGDEYEQLLAFQKRLRTSHEDRSGKMPPWHPEKTLRWVASSFESTEALEAQGSFAVEQAYEECLIDDLLEQLTEAANQGKQKIITITNTVSTAIEIFQKLQEYPSLARFGEPLLYHGRLASHLCEVPPASSRKRGLPRTSPRQEVFEKLKQRDGQNEPYLLITTHAIEVGCDLDADALITAFCNPDALIQRAGRCNRRCTTEGATITVVGERIPSYLRYLSETTQQEYLQALQSLDGRELDVSQLSAFMIAEEAPEDPRLIELFQMLHSYVYQGEISYEPLHKRGLLATRSWEPSVTVRIRRGNDWHELSVPLERLRLRKSDGELEAPSPHVKVYELAYEPGKGSYEEIPLRWGNAYLKREIIVELEEPEWIAGAETEGEFYAPKLGLFELPRIFEIWNHRSSLSKRAKDRSREDGKIIDYLAPHTEEP